MKNETRYVPIIVISVLILLVAGRNGAAQEFSTSDCARYRSFSQQTSFVLVIDGSGSMDGAPIDEARRAAVSFVDQVRPDDVVGVVSFSDGVEIVQPLTRDRNALRTSIARISPGGGTRLYDAIAAGVRMLEQETGVRVVVFLTDGDDNRSNLSIRNVRQMNIGENTILYGVGLGDVRHRTMRRLANATNGAYEIADVPGELTNLYDRIRTGYYEVYDKRLSNRSGITITSLPGGRPVAVNGNRVGETPVRLDGVQPGSYDVQILFDRGIWQCAVDAQSGSWARIQARERQIPLSLVIETAPTRAAVFIDDEYVGLSSMVPSRVTNDRRDVTNQLTIPSISPGDYTIRVVAAPEFDVSPNQVMEFPVTVTDERVYVKALIFMGLLEDIEGNQYRPETHGDGGRIPDPSDRIDQIFGSDDGGSGGRSTGDGSTFGDFRSRLPGN